MSIEMVTPDAAQLAGLAGVLAGWQADRRPVQLHPGDLGWHAGGGLAAVASDVRVWRLDGRPAAVGLLDSPTVLRLGVDPEQASNEVLARCIAADLGSSLGIVETVEARDAPALTSVLRAAGHADGEPWTPLRRDLSQPVEVPADLALSASGPEADEAWAESFMTVHRSAFRGTDLSNADLPNTDLSNADLPNTGRDEAVARWLAIAGGPLGRSARSLLATDHDGTPAAVAMVWTAGPGRPGLLEPVGVRRDRQGRGLGRAVTLAAAAELRRLGASSAVVCTPSHNRAAVRTYLSAGFTAGPPVPDLNRR